jgi:hypothetical protein
MLPIVRMVKMFLLLFAASTLHCGQALSADPAPAGLEAMGTASSSGMDPGKLEDIRNQAANVDLEKISATAKAAAAGVQLPASNEEAVKAAQQAAAVVNSAEFQNRLKQLQNGPPPNDTKDPAKETGEMGSTVPGNLAGTETIYVFLSSSMPAEDLHAYLLTISRAGEPRIIPVFYGMIGGIENIQNQGNFFGAIMREDYDCVDTLETQCRRFQANVQMNPALFAKYGVTEIPTVVFDDGQKSWSVEGAAELGWMLDKINRDAKNPDLGKIVKRMEGTR